MRPSERLRTALPRQSANGSGPMSGEELHDLSAWITLKERVDLTPLAVSPADKQNQQRRMAVNYSANCCPTTCFALFYDGNFRLPRRHDDEKSRLDRTGCWLIGFLMYGRLG
jgi:hypothetical protein